jgi:hypothetical protein
MEYHNFTDIELAAGKLKVTLEKNKEVINPALTFYE